MFNHSTVEVAATPTPLTAGVPDVDSNQAYRSVLISNDGATPVFLGGPAVTATDYGYELAVGGDVALDLGPGDVPFGIVDSGTGQVRVLHAGV